MQAFPHGDQAITALATEVKQKFGLRSVRLISADALEWSGWNLGPSVPPEYDVPETPVAVRLGKIAAPIIAHDIACQIVRDMYKVHRPPADEKDKYAKLEELARQPPQFKIAVASGSTVRSLVDSFQLPEAVYRCLEFFFENKQTTSLIPNNGKLVTVSPLVVGPLPETLSSAGFIADVLASKFPTERVNTLRIHNRDNSNSRFTLSLTPEVINARDLVRLAARQLPTDHGTDLLDEEITIPERPTEGEPAKTFLNRLANKYSTDKWAIGYNWVITGIGSSNTGVKPGERLPTGQLEMHLRDRFGSNTQTYERLRKTVVGDICSRLFDANGKEEERRDSDSFVGASFESLRWMSMRPGTHVVAVTGGMEKYIALKTLLVCGPANQRVFNELITDEITAHRLITDCRPYDPIIGWVK